ncbi:MAG: hypothetical protein HQL32_02585 [Planctomycetes bacterium]|nr:hypothetical protein [Planctomycetota bacterium]
MTHSELLDILFPWVLDNGLLNHSMQKIAEPTGLTKGGLCHYFKKSGTRGSMVADLGEQLIFYAREKRRQYVTEPIKLYYGNQKSKRNLFAQQMYEFLKFSYKKRKADQWYCPVQQLELELRHVIQLDPDYPFLEILDELWKQKDLPFQFSAVNLEKFFSGPYPASKEGVLSFFSS